MSFHQPADEPAEPVRRTALAVIGVAAALLVFAGGVVVARVLADRGGAADATSGTSAGTASPTTAAAGAVAPTTAAASGGGASSGDPPRCHTAGLRLSMSLGDGAAGSEYHTLAFTNVSGHTCRMYGFPGMAPIGSGGAWITDVRTVREPSTTPRLVTLGPGGTAWAVVHWGLVEGTYHGPACDPGAAGLVVTPPDETTQLTVRMPLTICGYGEIVAGAVTAKRPPGG